MKASIEDSMGFSMEQYRMAWQQYPAASSCEDVTACVTTVHAHARVCMRACVHACVRACVRAGVRAGGRATGTHREDLANEASVSILQDALCAIRKPIKQRYDIPNRRSHTIKPSHRATEQCHGVRTKALQHGHHSVGLAILCHFESLSSSAILSHHHPLPF